MRTALILTLTILLASLANAREDQEDHREKQIRRALARFKAATMPSDTASPWRTEPSPAADGSRPRIPIMAPDEPGTPTEAAAPMGEFSPGLQGVLVRAVNRIDGPFADIRPGIRTLIGYIAIALLSGAFWLLAALLLR